MFRFRLGYYSELDRWRGVPDREWHWRLLHPLEQFIAQFDDELLVAGRVF